MKNTTKKHDTVFDATDREILNELSKNSRLSLRQIAQNIGVSTATVMSRVRELEKNRVIMGYTAQLDYDKLGFDIPVVIELQVQHGKPLEVEKKLAKNPNIVTVYDTAGRYDVIVIAKFRTRKEMDNFIKDLQSWDEIERTNTKLILNVIKEDVLEV